MSNTTPVFSVCVPNFNYGDYIGRTLDSVLEQDFTDFEIIVVDNASTDHSWEVIQSYVQKDARVKAFRNRVNIGFAPNLQASSEKATGEYIIMLSSDDIMNPGALSAYHAIYSSGGKAAGAVIHSSVYMIDSHDKLLGYYYRFGKAANRTDDYFASFRKEIRENDPDLDGSIVVSEGYDVLRSSLLHFASPASFCTTAFPRKLWEQVNGYDTAVAIIPDSVFLFRLLATGCESIYIRRPLFSYRVHNTNQLSQSNRSGQIKYQLDGYNLAYAFPQSALDKIGITRAQLMKGYIDSYCFNESMSYLKQGNFLHAFKLWAFGFVTSPAIALRNIKAYLIGGAFVLFPVTAAFAAISRKK